MTGRDAREWGTDVRVAVVGAGIGGLALAQGLHRSGLDVVVVERDLDLARTGGYRLHLGVPALTALRELLDPSLVELLHASAARDDRGIAVRDHRGRLIAHGGTAGQEALDVDRVTLRLLLAHGLGDVLRLGRRCTGHEVRGDRVVTHLDDGSSVESDVLVGADGVSSVVATALAGRPTARPTGLSGVAGWTTADVLPPEARRLVDRSAVLAIGPGGSGLYLSLHDPLQQSPIRIGTSAATTREPRVIWGVIATDAVLPPQLRRSSSPEVVRAAATVLRRGHWADSLVSIVERADPEGVSVFRFSAADPTDIASWPSTRVTALGDAVHAVPPTGGRGAATAVVDAAELCTALTAAARGEVTPVMAVHDYERLLRPRAADAVRESLQPVGWIRATATPAGSVVARAALPLAALVGGAAAAVRRRR
ncbi:FAD-dependent oxidoreductase [Geodermatophilus africanus]|uniref:FAD-dependent oxidoreductase n=1 Tax=Geodermatophilus africanus TaxID=1137993 RepID=UPI00147DE753|nr:NAD(P)/FAD-dependent oxidoreductase [Geodermatophilus africanus]